MKILLTKAEMDWLQSFRKESNNPLNVYVQRICAVVFGGPALCRKQDEYTLLYVNDRLQMSAGNKLYCHNYEQCSIYELIAVMLSPKGYNKHYTFIIGGEYYLQVGPELFRWENKWVKNTELFQYNLAIEYIMQDKQVETFDATKKERWITVNELSIPEIKKFQRFRLVKGRTIIVNGHEVAEPIKDTADIKNEAWVVAPGRDELCYMTTKKHIRVQQLKKGLVHYTEENARKFAQAMLDWSTT